MEAGLSELRFKGLLKFFGLVGSCGLGVRSILYIRGGARFPKERNCYGCGRVYLGGIDRELNN